MNEHPTPTGADGEARTFTPLFGWDVEARKWGRAICRTRDGNARSETKQTLIMANTTNKSPDIFRKQEGATIDLRLLFKKYLNQVGYENSVYFIPNQPQGGNLYEGNWSAFSQDELDRLNELLSEVESELNQKMSESLRHSCE